jgi:hypothetical protein
VVTSRGSKHHLYDGRVPMHMIHDADDADDVSPKMTMLFAEAEAEE